MMTFTESIKTCIKKYATFSGRATRSEYWWFQLFIYLVLFFFVMLGAMFENNGGDFFWAIGAIFLFLVIIPGISSRVRRLHDVGYSGLFLFLVFIPYIGGFIVLLVELQGSDKDNIYGPNPNRIVEASNLEDTHKKDTDSQKEIVTDVEL